MKKQILFYISLIIFLGSCDKDEVIPPPSVNENEVISPPTVVNTFPLVSTEETTDIQFNEAVFNGKILSNGNANIIESGFCWSTSPDPDFNDNVIRVGSGFGAFKQEITDLVSGTKYFVKAYATNSVGTTFGEEREFTTRSGKKMFSADKIWKHALQNSKDKLLYFFTQEHTNTTTPSPVTIIAYNYANKEVTAEKEIGSYYLIGINSMPLHSIGMYNGQLELYILEKNTVKILNAITLEEIANFELPGDENLTSIRQENNLLFIGLYGYDKKLIVYNRETKMKISQTTFGLNSRVLTSYYDSETNNIYCISFPQFSNSSLFLVDKFDSSGNFISSRISTRYGDNNLLRVNNNSNALITGLWGNIYYKSDMLSGSTNDTRLLDSGFLVDYRFSFDGKTLYTLYNSTIALYNTSDYIKYKSIDIGNFAKNIFIDDNDIMVIHHNQHSTTDKNLYLTTH